MKEYMANKAVGFYLSLAAAVLSLAGIFIYGTVMYRFTAVYILLAAAVAVEIVMVVLLKRFPGKTIVTFLTVVNAALSASAVIWSVSLMVNQIGYVIAALDPISTITTFIVFASVGFVAMILNIVSSFMRLEK